MAPAHGFRCGISPGGEREPTSETEAPLTDGAPSGAPRVAERGRGAIGARNSHGGPGPHREPTASEGASPRSGGFTREREKRERTRTARAGLDRCSARAARAVSGRTSALVSGLPRRDAGSTRRVARRKLHGQPHSNPPPRVACWGPQGRQRPCGAETGRESRPGIGGKPPESVWKRRRGPSRIRPPATRGESSARRRGEPRP